MDPISLTLGAMVAGVVAKTATSVGDKAGDRLVGASEQAVRRIVERLRQQFADENDEVAATSLRRLEEAPDSPSRAQALATVIDHHAENEDFRAELETLVEQARARGVEVPAVTQSATGHQNVQINAVTDASVDVRFGPSAQPDPQDDR